jgi:hypothetical protein
MLRLPQGEHIRGLIVQNLRNPWRARIEERRQPLLDLVEMMVLQQACGDEISIGAGVDTSKSSSRPNRARPPEAEIREDVMLRC